MTTRNDVLKYALLGLLSILLLHCGGATETADAPAAKFTGEWTDTNFPPYIERITHFGQRADWSHDGKRILFLEKTYGDAYEIDLESGVIRAITHHYHHNGYTRVLYLSNGDILLSGSRTFDPANHSDARRKTAELWVLSKDLDKPPVALGEYCSEGPAVSRKNLRVAWAADYANHPDTMPLCWRSLSTSVCLPSGNTPSGSSYCTGVLDMFWISPVSVSSIITSVPWKP